MRMEKPCGCCLAASLLTVAFYASMALPTQAGLVGYYSFDSDFTDAAGSNDLTEVETDGAASVAITTNAAEVAKGSGAADFISGIGNAAYLNLATPITFGAGDAWSVSFWARRRVGTDDRSGMTAGNTGNTTDFIWLSNNPSQVQGLRFRSSSNQTSDFGGHPDDSQYHHWVVVADGAGNVNTYRDKVPQSSVSNPTPFSITAIGHGYSSNVQSMNGQIDDMAIFDQALSAGQVTDLYNGDFSEWFPSPTAGALIYGK